MESGQQNSLLSEEGQFIDTKAEMDDFLKSLTDSSTAEFKGLLSIIFHSLKTSFDNCSMYQRQLNDTQEKLKRHIRNKNDIIKNIEDDNERFGNLKNETENLYLKIDNLKHEEGEKDKEIKLLNEEIIKLNQRNDQENLSNFKPPELDIKMKLIQEREEYDSKISFLETKKHQQMMLLNSLTDDTRKSEKIGKGLEDDYASLQKEINDQQDILHGEKTSKENSDKQFLGLRQENGELKENIINLQEEEKLILLENDKLSKEYVEISDNYNNKKTEMNTLKVKIVPEMKSKLSEYERKNNECKKVKKI